MTNAFVYRMPAGIPGDVTRHESAKIEPQQMDADYPVTQFGLPVKMVSGKIRPFAAADTGQPYGFLVRPYPSQSGNANSPLGTAVAPDATKICDILVSGYMTVDCQNGTPAKNGSVYYRKTDTSPDLLIGGIEVVDSGNDAELVAITNAHFMGTADDDGNVEIAFNV